jgi:hypothetical protein
MRTGADGFADAGRHSRQRISQAGTLQRYQLDGGNDDSVQEADLRAVAIRPSTRSGVRGTSLTQT